MERTLALLVLAIGKMAFLLTEIEKNVGEQVW
jgi:hypothetical protein